MGGDAAGRAQGLHRALSHAARRAGRIARGHADVRSRQADSPVAQRDQRLARANRFLSRSGRAEHRDRDRVLRGRNDRADRPRAARRHRQHLGLELPVFRRRQRVRSGAADRQCGALQAVGIRRADGDAHRTAAARRGLACGSLRRVDRCRRGRHRIARAEDRRRFLHRLLRHRCAHRRGRRAANDQAAARARRQGPELRLRQRGPARRRRIVGRRRDVQHRPELLLGRADLCARAHPRQVRRGFCRDGQRLQARRPDGRVDLHRRDHARAATRRAREAGGRRDGQGRDAEVRGQTHRAQRQLVRADGAHRRRSLDGADARRELRPDHRHSESRERRASRRLDERHPLWTHRGGVYAR